MFLGNCSALCLWYMKHISNILNFGFWHMLSISVTNSSASTNSQSAFRPIYLSKLIPSMCYIKWATMPADTGEPLSF